MMWYNSWMEYNRHPRCILQYNPWLGWRIGEASNPGPTTIAALNVQSLNAFVDDGRFCNDLYDVTIYTETAATMFVQQKATKVAYGKGRHLMCSKPAAKRTFTDNRDCNTKGQPRGAAILSALPARPMAQQWSAASWDTSRVVDSILVHQHGYIVLVAIYGFHQGLPDADLHNEELLREAVQRTMAHDCPALIVGDLNCNLQEMAVWQDMMDSGWNDAALVQQSRDGHAPQKTYKEVSRIDYVLFNKKALPAFQWLTVSAQPETDHKTLVAQFDWSVLPAMRNVFRSPVNVDHIPMDKQRLLDAYVPAAHREKLQAALCQGDPQQAWITFCQAYEATLEFLLQDDPTTSFGARFKGRGQLRFRKEKTLGPVRKARHGEFNPAGDEVTLTLRQRIRQIRRLETYISQAKRLEQMSDLDPGWSRLHSATLATWTSILRSTGFHGSFVTWWFTEVGPVFPLQPPDACYAQWICETLRDREAQWRSMCRQHRQQHISQVFQQDWRQGAAKHFKAVKPPGLPRVDSLDVFTSHHITVCRSRKKGLQRCQLRDEDMHCIKIGATWKQAKAEAKVVDVSKGVIKLRKVKGQIDNGEICQYTPMAVPKAILHEAKTYWNQFWNTKRDEQPGDAMIQDAISALPQLSEMNPDFDMNDLEWALRKLQTGKAKGMDGFSNFELKYMPNNLKPSLLQLLNCLRKQDDGQIH